VGVPVQRYTGDNGQLRRLVRNAAGPATDREPERERRVRRRRTAVVVAAVAAVVPLLSLRIAYAIPNGAEPPPGVAGTTSTRPSTSESPPPTTPSQTGSTPGGQGASRATQAPTNRLPDPGFEAVPLNWGLFGPATVHAPTNVARGGAQALRITTIATSPVVAGATNRPVLVITAAGTTYTASCWVRATAFLAVYLQVQEYTTSWQRDGDPAQSQRLEINDPARWYQITVTYTAKHTGNQLPLTVFGSDMVAGGAALIADDCSLRIVPS
jgi:hypothetical protein